MNTMQGERSEKESVWTRYREAKRIALDAPESGAEERPQTLEELEEAIARTAASSGLPETGMPPRSIIHPSQHGRVTRWFYRVLVVLFVLLVAGLFWWGMDRHGG